MEITDNRYDQRGRRYFVPAGQYHVMRANQRACQIHRIKGHAACRRCQLLNYEKWRLCHTMPVMGSDKKTPPWKAEWRE